MIIFGVSIVDTYNIYNQSLAYKNTYRILLCALSEEIINNYLDSSTTRPPSNIIRRSTSNVPVRKRASAHLFQTCKKRRPHNSICTTYHNRGIFRIFQMKTSWMCYICLMEDLEYEHCHCNTKSGREISSSM